MTSGQDRKAPSAGTKVDPGQNAPVRTEGAGTVPEGSLAAESYRQGGGFSDNRNAQPDSTSASDLKTTSGATSTSNTSSYNNSSTSSGGAAARARSNDGAAPSYVENQYIRDPNGPHGKNLTEGGWDESKTQDGTQKAFNAEPGSINDPSRLAEERMELNQTAQAGGAGPRQQDLNTETAYDNLKSDVSA